MAAPASDLPFEGKVDITKPRKFSTDFVCALLLYTSIAVQAIMSFVIFSSKNSEVPVISQDSNTGHIISTCPSGYISHDDCLSNFGDRDRVFQTMDCITDSLCTQLKTCATDNSLGRRLTAEEEHLRRLAAAEARDVWEFLEQHFYQPTVLFGAVFVCAGLWLFAMQKAPRAVVWGTLVVDVLFMMVIFAWFYFMADTINWACLVLSGLMVVGCIVARKQIDNACVMMKIAMNGLFANKRLFLVAFAVQCVWIGFFALWIAGLIGMHYVKEARIIDPEENNYCMVQVGWTANGYLQFYWTIHYYWTTYFFKNVNLFLVTVNISGWYFHEDGYTSFWVSGLKWVLGPMSGGTAICAAIMGMLEYLLRRVESTSKIVLGFLNPAEWILICIGLCLKTVAMTYTKFGVIAMAVGGRPFCEAAPRAFRLLKNHLGEAVVTDYVGKKVMDWCTYAVAVGVAFAAWAWGDHVQEIAVLTQIPMSYLFFVMIGYAWLISYPFAGLIFVIFFEQWIGGVVAALDPTFRMGLNSVFASIFMGCISYFILNFISGIVVAAMDVTLFCYAVEASLGQKQEERFNELYGSIKETFVVGTVPGSGGVVVGSAPAGQPQPAVVQEGEPPVTVVGQAV